MSTPSEPPHIKKLKGPPLLRPLATALLLALSYLLIARFGLTLATLNNNTSPFWPATGFAIASVFIFGYRYSAVIFISAFLVNFQAATPPLGCLLMATGNSLEALLGAVLLRHISSRKTEFESLNELFAILGTSLLAPVISASLGTLGVTMNARTPLDLSTIWLTWWTGDLIGGLTVIPLGLALKDFHWRDQRNRTLDLLKFVILLALLIATLIYSFKIASYLGGVFIVFPILLLIQMSVGSLAVFVASFALSLLAVFLTVNGVGPFIGGSINQNLLNLQLFLASLALTALVLDGISRQGWTRLPTWALLSAWGLSSLLYTSFQDAEIKKDSFRFNNLSRDAESAIQSRMAAYVDTLYGGVSFIASLKEITPEGWHNFYINSSVDKRHPGIRGVGVIWPVASKDLAKFTRRERKFNPNFHVTPVPGHSLDEAQGLHYIITYVEPEQGNAPARGLDLASEANRRFAAEASRDSGKPFITPPINLVQDVVRRPGFLLLVPFYKSGANLQTPEQHRKNHLGWVYAPFVTQLFFEHISSSDFGEISMRVFEGTTIDDSKLLFSSEEQRAQNDRGSHFERVSHLQLAGLDLTLGWNKTNKFQSDRSTTAGWVALACSILSLLVALVIATLQSIGLRAKTLADEMTSQLSQSEKRFRSIVESSMIGTVISRNDGLIIDGNTPFLEMLGLRERNLQQEPLPWSLITQDKAFLNSLRGGDETQHFSGEITLTRLDGTPLPVLVGSTPLLGQNFNTIAYVIDLTESKRTQRELMKSDLKFRAVSKSAVDGIIIITAEGLISSWNEGARRIFDYYREEVLDTPILDLILFPTPIWALPAGSLPFSERVQSLLGKSTEVQAVRKDKLIVPAELTMSSWEIEGEKFYSAIIRDISERKKIEQELIRAKEEALEGVKTKSVFMANMSHEIRTPLNGIIGVADLLFETDLNPEQKRYAEIIQTSGSNLLNIINDILDFSKIEAGKLALESIPFDLTQLTEIQADLMMARARSKDISLATYVHPSLPSQFVGDPSRIAQILNNLISNAIKFTSHGGVKIQVTSTKNILQNPNLMSIRFEVSDTGIGISSEGISKLFQAFTQVDESTARHYGGTGLGLSICKSLASMMGGQIGVVSEPGHGSTFWFEIPLTVSSEGRTPKTTAHLKNLADLHVLIVESDPLSREVLGSYLSAWNIHHDIANSQEEAVIKIKKASGDSPLWNLILASCEGDAEKLWTFSKEIRETLGARAPIMTVLSDFNSTIPIETIHAHGIEYQLRKPLKQTDLFSTLLLSLQPRAPKPPLAKATEPMSLRKVPAKRILVVDDVGTNRLVVVQLIEKIGYSGFAVASGEEALQALALMPFDLILMDVQMPELDGYETTRRIRKLSDPVISKLPIIALTANALAGDEAKCLAAGMDDYLAKPVRMAVLAEKLKAWFDFNHNLENKL